MFESLNRSDRGGIDKFPKNDTFHKKALGSVCVPVFLDWIPVNAAHA
jgi:hypothetical protein